MSGNAFDRAEEMFDEWYQFCLENGVEPEKVVENYGEMMLVTDIEMIETIESL